MSNDTRNLSLSLRLTLAAADELDALAAAAGPLVPRHRLAVEALRVGAAYLAAHPAELLGQRPAAAPAPPSPEPSAPKASARPSAPTAAPPKAPPSPELAAAIERARVAILAANARGVSHAQITEAANLGSGGRSRQRIGAIAAGRDTSDFSLTVERCDIIARAAAGLTGRVGGPSAAIQ